MNRPQVTTAVCAKAAVPLRLRTAHGLLTFLNTTMVFGTPVDIPLSELAIETFASPMVIKRLATGHDVRGSAPASIPAST